MRLALILTFLYLLRLYWGFFPPLYRVGLVVLGGGILAQLVSVLNTLSYEWDVLRYVEDLAIHLLLYGALPILCLVKSLRSDSGALKLLSFLVCFPFVCSFVFWINSLTSGTSFLPARPVATFQGKDGYVYVVRDEEISSRYGESPICRSVNRYQRVLPGLLFHQMTIDRTEYDIGCFQIWQRRGNYSPPIEELKQKF